MRPSSIDYRQLLWMAFPMILSNITVPLLGIVDTIVVGHLAHAHYLAGVAVGSMICGNLFWMSGFLRMSTTGLTAQANGQGNVHAMTQTLVQALLVAVSIASILLLLQVPILEFALKITGASDVVSAYAADYFSIRIWSAPAVLSNYALLGWLLGMQYARGPLILLVITNLVNIGLDLLFVWGFEWDVKGVAAASVVADYIALLVGVILAIHILKRQHSGSLSPLLFLAVREITWQKMHGFMALNRDIFIRTLALQACFAFITIQGARLGDNYVAANAVLLNFLMFISFAMDGLAYAVEAQVGHSIGAKQTQRMRRQVRAALELAFIGAVIFAVFFWYFSVDIVSLLTSIDSIRTIALDYIFWIALLPLMACWCYVFDGVFIGAAAGKVMRNSMLVSSLGVFFPVWWFSQSLGNHALWLALSALMLARGLSLGWYYRRTIFVKTVN
ncbi:MATE family efflux transporter DinF [Alginatibacterium sediminis]|uniref:MATE family efflux transporter DinF n=1 Tax=Alginatibacterium sediminis TaxID=2164068 RepID=A0A420E5R5_9ALTE|nr:MATE family efflux transporter DinF [Alginatibacterium sediminis]RKF13134.1 MATE family efflux transporter DinF [Alginatibacterium sediminis]